jgi:hypothetical protein
VREIDAHSCGWRWRLAYRSWWPPRCDGLREASVWQEHAEHEVLRAGGARRDRSGEAVSLELLADGSKRGPVAAPRGRPPQPAEADPPYHGPVTAVGSTSSATRAQEAPGDPSPDDLRDGARLTAGDQLDRSPAELVK